MTTDNTDREELEEQGAGDHVHRFNAVKHKDAEVFKEIH